MKMPISTVAILERKGKRHTLRFVRILDHPPASVWRALTEKADLGRWFPTERYRRHAITAFDPPHVLELRHRRELLRFELTLQEQRTYLSFAHTYGDLASSARRASEWEHCLLNLEKVLAKRRPLTFSAARRNELFAKHAWELGPKASAKPLLVA